MHPAIDDRLRIERRCRAVCGRRSPGAATRSTWWRTGRDDGARPRLTLERRDEGRLAGGADPRATGWPGLLAQETRMALSIRDVMSTDLVTVRPAEWCAAPTRSCAIGIRLLVTGTTGSSASVRPTCDRSSSYRPDRRVGRRG
jgi:hypothetical protein